MIPADNILFASEMVGAVRGIDPETGHYFDDTKRYIDASGLERGGQAEDLRGQRQEGLFEVEDMRSRGLPGTPD